MHTIQKTVGKLLQGQTQFLMPFYQRRYVWDLKKVERLWEDILGVMEEHEGRHFLGSVVVAEIPDRGGMERWTVIDGQQRLTTLGIMFCAIRDHVSERDAALADKLDDLYLINKYYDGDRWFKVVPAMADRASWRKLLLSQVGADGDDRIGEAYRFFRAALRDADDDAVDIAALERTVAGQLDLVQITTGAEDNVHRIFESLNNAGQPLSPADLLRNHVLMRLGSRMERVYERHWEPLERLVSEQHLDELIYLSLVLSGEGEVAQKDVYQTLRARMHLLPDEAAVEAWVVDLHALARTFQHIVDPSTVGEAAVREAVDRLHQWGSKAFHAVAMRVLAAHQRGALSPQQTAEALRVVESYLVRRYLAEIEDKDNVRNLRALVRELGDRVPTAAELARLLSRSVREFPTDDQVAEALKGRLYRKRFTNPLKFILRFLERGYASPEPADPTAATVSIEHVLPQNPSQPWWDLLARDAGVDESAEDIHATLVHTLGNLTLTAENRKLGNLPFDEKRERLADSGFAMNREIARHKRWGRAEIEARTVRLTARILEIWPGPVAAPPTVAAATATSAAAAPAPAAAPAAPPRAATRRRSPRDRKLRRVLIAIPAGRWTSFAAIGEVVGVNPAKVPTILFEGSFPNAHRVLKKNGVPSEVFRWPDADRTESQRDVLTAEGVRFSQHGHALTEDYIGADDLGE
jgi:alkylated DNA nucleotide flippase Atl1